MKLFPVWGCFCGFKDSQHLLKGRAGGSKATHLGRSKGQEPTAATHLPSSWWLKRLCAAEPVFCSGNGALILPSGGNHAYMYMRLFVCVCVCLYRFVFGLWSNIPGQWSVWQSQQRWVVLWTRKNASPSTAVTRSLGVLDTPSVSLFQVKYVAGSFWRITGKSCGQKSNWTNPSSDCCQIFSACTYQCQFTHTAFSWAKHWVNSFQNGKSLLLFSSFITVKHH